LKKIFVSILLLKSLLYGDSNQDNIEKIGDYIQLIIPISAWATTLALGDTKGQIDFYKSFGATIATTQALKYTIDEQRPDGSDNLSFPSGHTSASFQGASFIHKRYGIKYAILPYIGASFVAFSRVYADKHYTHDVIAGALIGAGFAWYFTKPYKVKNIEIEPLVMRSKTTKQNLYGIKLTFN